MMAEDIIVQLEEDAEDDWPSRTYDWWEKDVEQVQSIDETLGSGSASSAIRRTGER